MASQTRKGGRRMKITDKEVLRHLRIVRCIGLENSIRDLPEDEVDDRTDLQILIDELEYLLSLYEDESGTCHRKDLEQAREFLKETKNGKEIPLKYLMSYSKTGIDNKVKDAKDCINEYNRLKKLKNRLMIK